MRIRQAVRALVLDPDDRALLVQFTFRDGGIVWATPGGGIEPDEEVHDALRRELDEELGLTEFEIGPLLWRRTHHFDIAGATFDGQQDTVFLVRTERFDPNPRLTWEQLNAEAVTDLRWWTLAEAQTSSERFAPRAFVAVYRQIVIDGPPTEALDLGT